MRCSTRRSPWCTPTVGAPTDGRAFNTRYVRRACMQVTRGFVAAFVVRDCMSCTGGRIGSRPTRSIRTTSRRTDWSGASTGGSPIRRGSPTSPTCRPPRAGCTWPACSTSAHDASSVGRCRSGSKRRSPVTRCVWRAGDASRRRASSRIRIAACNTPVASIGARSTNSGWFNR